MPLFITEQDRRRLTQLVGITSTEVDSLEALAARLLREKLATAEVVSAEAMPPDVVTLYSRVTCWDLLAAAEAELMLVPAEEHLLDRPRVSILSPLGVELLGARAGAVLTRDDDTTWRVLAVAHR